MPTMAACLDALWAGLNKRRQRFQVDEIVRIRVRSQKVHVPLWNPGLLCNDHTFACYFENNSELS